MISAIILAAGQSKRMGQPKMLLPWGQNTVLGHVLNVFRTANILNLLVITGGAREGVEKIAEANQARTIFNREFAGREMLSSLQVGLRALSSETEAVLIGLGDQPQVQEKTIRKLVDSYMQTAAGLIVPSYQMHRGHPWLVARTYWAEILDLAAPRTPRDFLTQHSAQIQYVEVDNPSVLADLDTLDDYAKFNPQPSS